MVLPYQSSELLGGGAYADVHAIDGDRVLKIARTVPRDSIDVTGGVFFAQGLAFATGSVGVRRLDPNEVVAQEISTLRRITHPSMPRVLESGGDAQQYFVMPHFRGENWRTAIYRDRAIGLDHLVAVTRALSEMSSELPMHGDLKPENLMLTDDGAAIRILDPSAGSNVIGPVGVPIQMLLTDWYNPALEVSDLPALGLLIVEALTGQHLWLAATEDRDPKPLGPKLTAWVRLRETTGGANLLRRVRFLPMPTELDSAFDPAIQEIALRCLSLEWNGERLEATDAYDGVGELYRALDRLPRR